MSQHEAAVSAFERPVEVAVVCLEMVRELGLVLLSIVWLVEGYVCSVVLDVGLLVRDVRDLEGVLARVYCVVYLGNLLFPDVSDHHDLLFAAGIGAFSNLAL